MNACPSGCGWVDAGPCRSPRGAGDYAEADVEYRDVLTATLRVLGSDHPSTLAATPCIDHPERPNKTTDALTESGPCCSDRR